MKEITMYRSEDGKLFQDASECLTYEDSVRRAEEATRQFKSGRNLLETIQYLHSETRVHYREFPIELLQEVNKDTLFTIPYWQLCYLPRYYIRRFYQDGSVMLQGSSSIQFRKFSKKIRASELLAYMRQLE